MKNSSFLIFLSSFLLGKSPESLTGLTIRYNEIEIVKEGRKSWVAGRQIRQYAICMG